METSRIIPITSAGLPPLCKSGLTLHKMKVRFFTGAHLPHNQNSSIYNLSNKILYNLPDSTLKKRLPSYC